MKYGGTLTGNTAWIVGRTTADQAQGYFQEETAQQCYRVQGVPNAAGCV